MRINIEQQILKSALNVVRPVISTKTTLPILSHFLVEFDGESLHLTGTDLQTAIIHRVSASGEGDGLFTVPAAKLTEFVNALPTGPVSIDVDGQTVKVRCGGYRATLHGMDPEDYPPIVSVDQTVGGHIEARGLRLILDAVAYAAAKDETRPVLAGVHLHGQDDGGTHWLKATAADGFRLGQAEGLGPNFGECLVPASAVAVMLKLLPDEGECRLLRTDSQIVLEVGDTEFRSQLLHGTFPDVSKLIPQNPVTTARVGVDQLLRAIRTVDVFARDGDRTIRLRANEDNTLRLWTVNASGEGDGDTLIFAEVDGPSVATALHDNYFLGAVSHFAGEVEIALTSTTAPVLFRSPEQEKPNIGLVMPVFVADLQPQAVGV